MLRNNQIRRGLLAMIVGLTVAPVVAAERGGTPAQCESASPRSLALHVVNEVGVAPALLEAAAAEASAIWAGASIRLTWTFAPEPRPVTGGQTLVVILRRGLSHSYVSGADLKSRSDQSLGWLYFDANERPGNLIQLSFDAIAALARQGRAWNVRLGTLPDDVQEPVLGRAVGRVIAHEVGHWLTGQQHTRDGLMRATFRERDLIDSWAPQAPRRGQAPACVTSTGSTNP